MKTIRFVVIATAIGLSLTSQPALAHHSLESYDQTKLVTIKGTVTRIDWVNPHAVISLSVRNADGSTTETRVEMAPPNALKRAGFTMDLFQIGDAVTFETWVLRDPKDAPKLANANCRTVTLADGRRFDSGNSLNWMPIPSR